MTKERIDTGKRGEEIAVDYLKKSGYKIIERNYKNSFGEIDIIAQEKDTLVFLEIKTRKDVPLNLFPPQMSVYLKKQAHIIKTSIVYLKQRKINPNNTSIRYDVVSIIMSKDSDTVIENGISIIKNAFQT